LTALFNNMGSLLRVVSEGSSSIHYYLSKVLVVSVGFLLIAHCFIFRVVTSVCLFLSYFSKKKNKLLNMIVSKALEVLSI
jgi:hypothetical protein